MQAAFCYRNFCKAGRMKTQINLLLPVGNTALKVLSLVAMLVLCTLFFLLVRQINNMNRAANLVNHTNLVRKDLSEALAKLKDAEARQRGFLLTNDSSFLDGVAGRRRELDMHLANLRNRISDIPVQTHHADTLRHLIDLRLQLLEDALRLHRQSPNDLAALGSKIVEGKKTTEAIERHLQFMDSLEVSRLKEQTAANDRFLVTTPRLAAFLVLAALFTILTAFFRQRQLLALARTYLKESQESGREAQKNSLLLQHAEQINNAGSWEWNYTQDKMMLSANMFRLLHLEPDSTPRSADLLLSLLDAKDREGFLNLIVQRKPALPETFSTRFWMTCTSGQRKYFQCNGRMGANEAGEMLITGTVHDVTEEEMLKQQLAQRKDLIESLVENSSDLVSVIDTDMRYTVWNRANEQRFGLPKEKVLGQRIEDVFPFLLHDERLQYIKNGLAGIAVYATELPYFNGQKTAEFSYVPLTNAEENVIGLLIMAHDITERKRAAENLKKANETLRQKNNELEKAYAFNRLVTDLAPSNIVVFDTVRKEAVFLNKQAETMFGEAMQTAKRTGENLMAMVVHPEDLATEVEKISRLQETMDGEIIESDCRFKDIRGHYRQMHIWRTVFKRNANGGVEQFISVSVDLTALKKAEESLKERNRELQLANEEISSFNYIASHDMQEPLRKVQIFANLLQESENELSSQGTLFLKKIQGAAQRMRTLINDLLSFSEINMAGTETEAVDLNLVLIETKEVLKAEIEAKGASISAYGLPVVRGVSFQLQQLFENIVSNAIKYGKPGVPPVLTITANEVMAGHNGLAALEQGRVYHHLRFADNGVGFKPEYSAKIFEMFERLHHKNLSPGTGLGLTICKKVVQNHGGIIQATGRPGEGALIDVYLPLEDAKLFA